ncbi:hypothetical protein AK812_SmicGene23161 [Symbiodinium microadriaticum]|uniref:Uncharacterized protein n=2 Tax=Symbiodinium microadriaticum TaxID=2951 RepID=A0A1Q9DHW2_SYMMI|nr:hypothetical protein AK812_SmicGene23161 [Symbiodinium microadriaticum]
MIRLTAHSAAEELEGRFSKLEAVATELKTQLQAEDVQSRLAMLEASAALLPDLDTAMAELQLALCSVLDEECAIVNQFVLWQGAAVAEALFGGSAAPEDDPPAKSDSGPAIEALSSQLARLEEQLGAARLPELRREMEEPSSLL